MKKTTAAMVIIGLLAAAAALVIPSLLSDGARENAIRIDIQDPKNRILLSAPGSLSIALARLGIQSDISELAAQSNLGPEGIGLGELEKVARSFPDVRSQAVRLDWAGLKRLDGTAVLSVKGDRFIAADPRATAPNGIDGAATVKIYEDARPARWVTGEELNRIWSGETLTIERQVTASSGEKGPRLVWDTIYVDNGAMAPNTVSRHVFSFRNAGTSDLTIDSIQKSCGCSAFSVSSERLAPGETGFVEAEVDLTGKGAGISVQRLTVNTNDPGAPMTVLMMGAGVMAERVLSTERIDLGDMSVGQMGTWEFFATDPGFGGFQIKDISFETDPLLAISAYLRSEFSYSLLGDDVANVGARTGYRGRPEDYSIRLELEVDEKSPKGPFAGLVNVVLESEGISSTYSVLISGMVVSDVNPAPRMALLVLDDEGAGSVNIRLSSHSKRAFEVVETWVEGGPPVSIRRADGEQSPNGVFVLSVMMPDVEVGGAPIEATAFFRLGDLSVVSMPISVYRPPQSRAARVIASRSDVLFSFELAIGPPAGTRKRY